MTTQAIATKPMENLKKLLTAASVREQFQNALRDNADLFVASIIDLYGSSTDLQQCDAGRVIAECLKAATLRLPLNRQLGFAWIVPYREKGGPPVPQFQIGYKGYIQLALRTGQYRYINAGTILQGVKVSRDTLTGSVSFDGEPTSDQAQGYFAYIETVNGFKKTLYMTKAEVERHALRFSKSYKSGAAIWKDEFDPMAQKTVLRMLLSKYGYMSIEMAQGFSQEEDEAHAEAAIDEGMAGAPEIEAPPPPPAGTDPGVVVKEAGTYPAPRRAPFVQ